MSKPVPPALAEARRDIDDIDARLIGLLVERFAVAQRVVGIKREAGLPALLEDRVEEVLSNVETRARQNGLPEGVARDIWRQLISATIAFEEKQL
ncbi:chorismate mutase [Xanthobacter sp. TB0139]|uniref:chorismate mutase n=1 Tax=Xanthobacter sp. TB0139 TaxID=3459178 RepID=UPI00403A42C9